MPLPSKKGLRKLSPPTKPSQHILTKGRIEGKGTVNKERGSKMLPAKGASSQFIMMLKGCTLDHALTMGKISKKVIVQD